MALSISGPMALTLSARMAGGAPPAFNPQSLFDGADGLFYSDATLSFNSTTALTPVADTAAAGFILDTSEGAGYSGGSVTGLGAELVTNGTFDTVTTGWTAAFATLSVVTGQLAVAPSDNFTRVAEQSITTVPSKTHILSFDYDQDTSTTPRYYAGSTSGSGNIIPLTSLSGSGTVERVLVATGTETFFHFGAQNSSGQRVLFDNISVPELPGDHATQATGSFQAKRGTSPDRWTFDGTDDRMETGLNPTTTGSIAARFNGATASRFVLGSQGASDGRCYLGLASDGSIAGGIGAQATSTIKGTTDKRSTWVTAVLTWDETTVKLYEDGTEVYSAAQSGAVNTTVPFLWGALNNNGTAAAFWEGSIAKLIVTDDVITPEEVTSLHNLWSSIE